MADFNKIAQQVAVVAQRAPGSGTTVNRRTRTGPPVSSARTPVS